MKKKCKGLVMTVFITLLTVTAVGCQGNSGEKQDEGINPGASKLSGKISIDGSSTVYPISAAVAEEFKKIQDGVDITVALSGTGGGMKKFSVGEIDICDASRPIKEEEIATAKKNGIDYTEFMVAYDGISVVVNKANQWIDNITVEELNKIWNEKSTVKTWKEVNDKWPNEPIKLYGPGTDSGTFEYFTEAINKKAKSMRKDFTPSEDDNVLVKGVEGDKNAMGYFGYAYYLENKDKLKVLTVSAVAPDFSTIKDGSYKPLSRPLFIYVNNKSLSNGPVKEFVKYYLSEGIKLIKNVGYIELDDVKYKKEFAKIK